MRELPILFNAEMVRAILAGRKTVTRRPVVDAPAWTDAPEVARGTIYADEHPAMGCDVRCPYGAPGDRLYVREAWTSAYARGCFGTLYRADNAFEQGKREHANGPHFNAEDLPPVVKWRPSLHLPRWASRIMLDVVSVRVERVQSITENEGRAEGILWPVAPHPIRHGGGWLSYRLAFAKLWDGAYGKTSPFDANPWVWRVEFRRVGAA